MTTESEYSQALEWLFGQTRSGRERSPAVMAAAIRQLGLQLPRRVAHVVGTNGKGTVSSMIAAGMQATGITAGLFISPHVEDFRERMSVDGQLIGRDEVVQFVQRMRAADDLPDLAFFEYSLALALEHFSRKGAHFVALEAGVGARHDATMAVGNTALTVVTSIALDHTQTLGDTVSLIAADKAAAIRPGVPVVTAEQGEAREVIEAVAAEAGSPLHHPDTHPELFSVPADVLSQGTRAFNQRLAAAGLRVLGADEAAVRSGVSRRALPGRGERFLVSGRQVLLDGAHDPAAARALVQGLEPGYTLIYGGLGRKQRQATCAVLAEGAAHVISTAVQPEEALAFEGARLISDNREALEAALATAGPGGLVVIAGSLYLAGSMRPLLSVLTPA